MGDAILAFFGAPIAHEDDPQRATLAALDILNGIGEYRDKVRREKDLDFAVRVGLNTGLVVVGNIGNDLKYESPRSATRSIWLRACRPPQTPTRS